MPLAEVTYAPGVAESKLRELGSALPHLVSKAVACPEEPYDGALQPGDVEIRFRRLGPLDRSGLDVVIEVRSNWFDSRAANRQERVDMLHQDVRTATRLRDFAVYLSLPSAAWSQGGLKQLNPAHRDSPQDQLSDTAPKGLVHTRPVQPANAGRISAP